MEFTHENGDKYIVTGVKVNGQRFRSVYGNPHVALAINLYRGSVWQQKGGKGKRTLLKRVCN
jgi:hypothetical protein